VVAFVICGREALEFVFQVYRHKNFVRYLESFKISAGFCSIFSYDLRIIFPVFQCVKFLVVDFCPVMQSQ